MSLRGELSDTPFNDLFDVLVRDDKQGLLTLEKGSYTGQLYIYKGEPFAAFITRRTDYGEEELLVGEDAVHHMSNWEEGQFNFDAVTIQAGARNIFTSKHDLLLANVFKRSNFNDLPSAPPNLSPTPIPALETSSFIPRTTTNFRAQLSQLDLQVKDWAFLIQVDNVATFKEVATNANLSLEEAWPILQKLIALNLIVLTQPEKVVAVAAVKEKTAVVPTSPAYQMHSLSKPGAISQAHSRQTVFVTSDRSETLLPLTRPAINMLPPKRGLISSIMTKLRGV